MCVYIYIYIYMYIYIYIYIHIYVCVCVCANCVYKCNVFMYIHVTCDMLKKPVDTNELKISLENEL